MTLPVPNLDDRDFADLVREARETAARLCPEWTDMSVHDPGMTLVEVFAHLTEVMLYRLNRLPEKAYVEFLNLLGLTRHPPSAAWTTVTFSRTGGGDRDQPIPIPAGTRIAATRGAEKPAVFITLESAVIGAGADEAEVDAYHCEVVAGELLGLGTGAPGQVLRASQAPIVTGPGFDVLLGVQTDPEALADGAAAREHDGKTFEIWRADHNFATLASEAAGSVATLASEAAGSVAGAGAGDKVYLLDRGTGTVTFAPAVDPPLSDVEANAAITLAAVPPVGREIRLWYRTGGGPEGNVAAGTLTSLRDAVPGVAVTNRESARGGRAMESMASAMARGPHELFSMRRAVTAGDFEVLATSGPGGVARAKAFTRGSMWSFARPGEVEVVLVPHVAEAARPEWRLPVATVVEHQAEEARRRTQEDLDGRRALGTAVITTWARYKAVSVRGRVVVRAQEDRDAVRRRIHDRLHQVISPLPTKLSPTGWAFGQPLRASNVYRQLEQAEPGVRYVDDVRFVVEDAPDQRVRTVAADAYQADCWYAGSGENLFRSTNGGVSWELVVRFPDEEIRDVTPAPSATRPGVVARPGCVVVVTRTAEGGSAVHLSTDLASSFTKLAEMEPAVADVAWIDRDDRAALLLATDTGLYELPAQPGSVPLQVLVDSSDADRGFYAVASFVSEHGVSGVAVAAQALYGVYLSVGGGRPGTFTKVGLSGVDTRTLAVQMDGPATILWVGAAEADPKKPGQGCLRARLFEADVRWQALPVGWTGGTCRDLAFEGTTVAAASQSGGILRLDTTTATPQWQSSNVNCGLPLRDRTRFEPVDSVACAPGASGLLIGGGRGVFRAAPGGLFVAAANRETRDLVAIPETWLLCSGEHDIEVVSDDAPRGD